MRQEPLANILDKAETNMMLHAIRIWGPRILVEWLREYGFDNELPKEFIEDSICDICHQLFSRPDILHALQEISWNPEITTKIAYGRVYYLQESSMVERLTRMEQS